MRISTAGFCFSFCITLTVVPAVAAPPTAPDSISARTTTAGYIEVNWSRASDPDGTVALYEMQRNDTTINVGNVTQYIDSDVYPGTSYTYRITAVDNQQLRSASNASVSITFSNDGVTSNSVSATMGDNGPGTVSYDDYIAAVIDADETATSPSDSTIEGTIAASICIDSDDDGWGWDGEASCLVDPGIIAVAVSVCIDIDGDGWGWTGEKACRIELDNPPSSTTLCIDTDGDGWSWTGEKSCIP